MNERATAKGEVTDCQTKVQGMRKLMEQTCQPQIRWHEGEDDRALPKVVSLASRYLCRQGTASAPSPSGQVAGCASLERVAMANSKNIIRILQGSEFDAARKP